MAKVKIHNIEDSIIDGGHLYAHIDDSKNPVENKKKPELISEHLERTLYFFNKLDKEKHVGDVVHNIIYNLKFRGEIIEEKQAELIEEFFVNAVYLHDMGKINPAFQYKRMNNNNVNYIDNPDAADSSHSLLSALIYIDIFLGKVNSFEDRDTKKFLRYVLLSFAYVISRHHTYLVDMEDFLDEIKRLQERIIDETSYVKYYKGSQHIREGLKLSLFGNGKIINDKHDAFEFYVLTKLLYSAIVSCDFYATYYYDTGNEPEFNYINNIDEIMKDYGDTDVYKGIQEYKKDSNYFRGAPINSLRSRMFIEAEENLKDNLYSNIYYLEAPTGGGKTNTSINLCLNVIKYLPNYNKIIYIFPFNTLVEQTKKTFDDIFNKESLKTVVINSVTPIVTEKEKDANSDDYEGRIDYKKDYLNRQLLQYPVVLTTHVNLFNYLFGTGREINLPLIHFCNSVIIMDEIQSYRNDIWPEIIKFLNDYSKLLNIKIIIMSATLPKLDELLHDDKVGFCELIKNKDEYYKNQLFKDRVNLNFDLLSNTKTTKEQLINKIDDIINSRDQVRMLIEFIKKTTARDFFQILKEKYPNKEIVELTGDDSNFIRNKILNIINEKGDNGDFVNKDIIVVATQVIEAGVNIDMDVGLKDISLLDGEEQFLGRINRSCLRKNCWAYFFNFDEASDIYKRDLRLEKDLTDKRYQQFLIDKNFREFYSLCFQRLDDKKKENNSNSIKRLDEDVLYLKFNEVNDIMQLITDENYQIYLSYTIHDDETERDIDAASIWCEYKNLIEDKEMDYSERKIKLSELSEKMAYFTYNYCDYKNKFNKEPKHYKENVGRLYYVEDGADFITEDGKFDRKKYDECSGGKYL